LRDCFFFFLSFFFFFFKALTSPKSSPQFRRRASRCFPRAGVATAGVAGAWVCGRRRTVRVPVVAYLRLFTIIFYIFALPLRGDSRSRVVTLLQTYARARRVEYMGIVEDTNMDRNNRRRTLGKNGGEGDPNEGECVGVGFFFSTICDTLSSKSSSLTQKMSKLNKIWRFERR
jgi:hypothetical protein